jgi:Domain of unknown function (DUF1906)
MPGNRIMTGGDWSQGIMDYALYRSYGFRFAMRYIVPSIPGKMIRHAEIISAGQHGVDLGFVYEKDGAGWRSGSATGTDDGIAARMALQSIDAPESCAAYFTIDAQVESSQMLTAIAYLDAAAQAVQPYRAGAYGQYDVIEHAWAYMPELFRWQTMAWSGGRVSDHADLLQVGHTVIGGIDADSDVAYTPRFGQLYANQWQQPVSPREGDDMSGFISPSEILSVPVPVGTASKLLLFADTGLMHGEDQVVRVAIRSETRGYSQIITERLADNVPVTVVLTARDVDGISLSRTDLDGGGVIGYAIV